MDGAGEDDSVHHSISVVIPVYQGEHTLRPLVRELEAFRDVQTTPDGHRYRVAELLLVHDNGPDGSAEVIRSLVAERDFIHPVWLSRNFGQHAATLAGMSSSGGDWIVTLDEDGQHDPRDIASMLDVAMAEQATLVYARATNSPPHGPARNAASAAAKWVFTSLLTSADTAAFSSYRLVLGEIGRSVAAYAGSGVFLDVAMGWVSARTRTCPVVLRQEGDRRSGYSWRRLLSHFWRLVISSGTRGLRLVSLLGVAFAIVGVVLAIVVASLRLAGAIPVQGWTSVMITVLVGTGAVLFALGVIAEYIGAAVNMAMGKPLYLIVSDPRDGPLGVGKRRASA